MLRGTRSPDPPAVVAAAGEVHSGAYLSFLSETQAQEGLRPPPAAQRRGPGLRLRLLLWLLLCGLTPTLLILTVAAARAALQAQIHLSQVTLLLRDSLPVEPRGATPSLGALPCSALVAGQQARLRKLRDQWGYEIALYSDDRALLSTFPAPSPGAAQLAPALPGALRLRALEQSPGPPLPQDILHGGRRYLGMLTGIGANPGAACPRLLVLLAQTSALPFALRPLLPRADLLALLLLPLLFGLGLLPWRLSSQVRRLHGLTRALTRRSSASPHLPAHLLRRGDEVGELARSLTYLGEVVQHSEARLSARLRELTTLHAIGRAISVLDLDEALRKIVSETVGVFNARRGALVLQDGEGRCTLGASVRMEQRGSARSGAEGGNTAAVTALGEALIRRRAPLCIAAVAPVADARPGGSAALLEATRSGPVDDADLPALRELAQAAGLSGSLMAAPLDRESRSGAAVHERESRSGYDHDGRASAAAADQQGRVLGVLIVTRSRGKPGFTASDLQLLATVADQASIAVSNARLYDEVQRATAELEQRVAARTQDLRNANGDLERALADLHRAQAQLLLSERLAGLGQLVAGVAHEINSPAAAIQGAADALRENVARIGDRARALAELPQIDHRARRDFLSACDRVAQVVIAGPLPAPALLRRRARALTEELIRRCPALPDLLLGGRERRFGASAAEDESAADESNAALQQAGRQLAELGVDGPPVDALLSVLAACLNTLTTAEAQGAPARHTLTTLCGYLEERVFLHRNAHAIRASIGQITRIVGALKSYSHLDQGRQGLTHVHEGLETTLVILHSELKYGILLTRKYGAVPTIYAFVDELNQVWTNLLHNAVQALQGQPDPTRPKEILIETGTREALAPAVPGGATEVWVAIEDNGPGIPAEVLPRIFDPFFTTKAKGEGTGIGLGIARQIVEKHGGRIEVESAPSRTRFTVFLPERGPASA